MLNEIDARTLGKVAAFIDHSASAKNAKLTFDVGSSGLVELGTFGRVFRALLRC